MRFAIDRYAVAKVITNLSSYRVKHLQCWGARRAPATAQRAPTPNAAGSTRAIRSMGWWCKVSHSRMQPAPVRATPRRAGQSDAQKPWMCLAANHASSLGAPPYLKTSFTRPECHLERRIACSASCLGESSATGAAILSASLLGVPRFGGELHDQSAILSASLLAVPRFLRRLHDSSLLVRLVPYNASLGTRQWLSPPHTLERHFLRLVVLDMRWGRPPLCLASRLLGTRWQRALNAISCASPLQRLND